MKKDDKKEVNKEIIYQRLFLRTPDYCPYFVYCSEMHSSVTLVIITRNAVFDL